MRRIRSWGIALLVVAIASVAAVAAAAPRNATIGFVQSFQIAAGTVNGAITACPEGEMALSGGLVHEGTPDDMLARTSGPVGKSFGDFSAKDGARPFGWVASASTNSSSKNARVFVVCAAANAVMAVKRFTGSTGKAKRVKLKCPGKRRALGGGILQKTNAGFDYLRESGPTDGGKFAGIKTGDVPRGWRAVLYPQSDDDVYKLAVVCVKKSKAVMQVALRKPSSPTFDIDHGVDCPGTKRPVGGGLLYDGPADRDIYGMGANGPLDETFTTANTELGDVPEIWYGVIANFSSPIADRFKVIALCE